MGFLNWLLTTNKGEKTVKVPISWEFVTLKQYAQLNTIWDGKELVQLFSILSGMPVKTLNDTFDPALYEQLEISTQFIFNTEAPFKKAEKPKTITVNGKTLHVPANLKGLTIGQSILVRQALDSAETYYEVMALALACYFQPQYDNTNEFSDKRAMELLPHFESMPAMEGYGIAVFLLKKLESRGRTIGQNLLHQITQFLSRSSKSEML